MKKVPLNVLGDRVNAAYAYQLGVRQKFDSFPDSQKKVILFLITEYVVGKINNFSATKAHALVQQLSAAFGMDHPFDLYATKSQHSKFLGYDHVWQLCYSNFLDKITLATELFSDELFVRQEKLMSLHLQAKNVFLSLDPDQRTKFLSQIKDFEEILSRRDYSELKDAVLSFEQEYNLQASLYDGLSREKDQIYGVFNAIVSVFSCLLSQKERESL